MKLFEIQVKIIWPKPEQNIMCFGISYENQNLFTEAANPKLISHS